MREIDRLMVERCGIPYATLMETAGSRVVEAMIDRFGPVKGKSYTVYCGRGNNGGDGAVVARLLWMRGAFEVNVLLFGKIEETRGEARVNFEAVRKIAEQELSRGIFPQRLTFSEIDDETDEIELYPSTQFVVDALLGTGVTRPAEGLYARGIEAINESGGAFTKVISIDIPSGLASDSEQAIGAYVRAHLTVTLTSPKIANAIYSHGEMIVTSIGAPKWLIEEETRSDLYFVEEEQIAGWLHDSIRSPDAHKGSAGDVLLIAGSRGKSGAATLASETVLRAGAGLVTVATARSAQGLLITQTKPEVMTEALDEIPSGAISHSAIDRALQLASNRTLLAIGPGLSSSDESTRQFVREFVEGRGAPIVIDADGLNALAPWPQELKGSVELPIIITPHPGEMARLINKTNAEVIGERISVAREFAVKHRLTVILKGSRTVIAAPDGEVFINPTGNAGMATAGSGDVLTGLTAGLLAQDPEERLNAVVAAVYLHGLAGDIASTKLGMRSLIASDIINNISEAILRVGGNEEREHTTI